MKSSPHGEAGILYSWISQTFPPHPHGDPLVTPILHWRVKAWDYISLQAIQKGMARRGGKRLSVSVGSQLGMSAVMHFSTANVLSL